MTSTFPHPVPQPVGVVMADGVRLAANLTLPEGEGPFPVLISFYPYRKDDFIGASAAYAAGYFAEAGYASLLVDVRGYGGSGGRAWQAWDPREFEDAAAVIAWAAAQPWCDGSAGVWGSSYGGAQALGAAAQRPPALKAIASVYGAADIYEDFVYPGGCANALGASAWSALVVAQELAPPSLQDPQGLWLDAWRDRLDRLSDGDISSMIWPAHPERDAYWRRRAIPVEDIEVPSFFLSGWRDLLCKGMLDAYARCAAPKRLLVGPWSHAAPDSSLEAPYEWLLELRLWWDQWLKGHEVEPRPPVVYHLQGADAWRAAPAWPPAEAAARIFYPARGGKLSEAASEFREEHRAQALVGTEAGLWYPMGVNLGGAFEPARDEARSLAFTSTPLDADLDILGAPRARLRVECAGGREANLCVKLSVVGPDDRSVLVSSGWLKLPAGRDPAATAEVELYPTAFRAPCGSRLRWTVACADFPRIWPTPETPTITLIGDAAGASCFEVPLADAAAGEPFDPPLPQPGVNRAPWANRGEPLCRFTRDAAREAVSITAGVSLAVRLPQGGTFALEHAVTAEMEAARPAAASVRTRARIVLDMAGGDRFEIDAEGLAKLGRRHLHGKVTADGVLVFERRWTTLNGR